MRLQRSASFLALSACLLAAPAHASFSVSSSLTDITFTLTDLDPDDGIEPWYTFIESPDPLSDTLTTSVSLDVLPRRVSDRSDAVGSNLAVNLDRQGVVSHASTGPTSVQVSANATGLPQADFRGEAAIAARDDAYLYGLQLSPNTRLTVTAQAEVSANLSSCFSSNCFAYARAMLVLSENTGFIPRFSYITADTGSGYANPRFDSALLSGSVANITSTPQIFEFLAHASAHATVVPEPQTWWLLGAGLPLVWRQLRSRRA
jgi:hypothetical protein